MYIYIYVYMCVCVCIHMYIYIHACIYMYIYKLTKLSASSGLQVLCVPMTGLDPGWFLSLLYRF